ncbi:MAG: hypothetical protein JWO58_631 [Chitinophagaceae bacterium]|nr:hypothetical protein [Chitinophagaceae bacterium]
MITPFVFVLHQLNENSPQLIFSFLKEVIDAGGD